MSKRNKEKIDERLIVKTGNSVSWKKTAFKIQSYYEELVDKEKTKIQNIREKQTQEAIKEHQEYLIEKEKKTIPELLEELDQTLNESEKKQLKEQLCIISGEVRKHNSTRYTDMLKEEIINQCKNPDLTLSEIGDAFHRIINSASIEYIEGRGFEQDFIKQFPEKYKNKIKQQLT